MILPPLLVGCRVHLSLNLNNNSMFCSSACQKFIKAAQSTRRTIMNSSELYAKSIEALKSNPYFEKYGEKIQNKHKASPEEFLSRWSEHEAHKKGKHTNELSEKPSFIAGEAKHSIKDKGNRTNLNAIMKLELIEDKNADEIKKIWEEFHKHKDQVISATIPTNTYNLIQERSKKYPIFLLPLPRNQGYEFIVLQFAGNEVHFTPLISYQTHKENAPECLTIAYFSELQETKKIILMKGEYDKNVIDMLEALCLANQLQLFYGENNEKRTRIMDQFTFHPNEFKHIDLIAEIDCLSF